MRKRETGGRRYRPSLVVSASMSYESEEGEKADGREQIRSSISIYTHISLSLTL